MLRNILGPIFNLYLDQFLTHKFCVFFWGWNPYFIVFQQNMQNLKKHQKRKKKHYLWTQLC